MSTRLLSLGLTAALLAGCSDDGDTGPPESALVIAQAPTKSGDQQEGVAGEQLASTLRVIVTRDDAPVGDVAVEWRTNDGLLSPTSSNTDAEGVAQSAWTLGPAVGEQSATARVNGAEGSPVTFRATATDEPPPPGGETVQVLTAGGNRFEPEDITIAVGQTVTWVWPEGSIGHNVVPDNGTNPAPSGALSNGPHTYIYTFATPGVYRYYCAAHGAPNGIGMSGTVTVLTNVP